jgi:hypothetical protein
MEKEKVAHKAVLLVKIEVHDILSNGECSGNSVSEEKLIEHGLKNSMVFNVRGNDLNQCLKNLKKRLNNINE